LEFRRVLFRSYCRGRIAPRLWRTDNPLASHFPHCLLLTTCQIVHWTLAIDSREHAAGQIPQCSLLQCRPILVADGQPNRRFIAVPESFRDVEVFAAPLPGPNTF